MEGIGVSRVSENGKFGKNLDVFHKIHKFPVIEIFLESLHDMGISGIIGFGVSWIFKKRSDINFIKFVQKDIWHKSTVGLIFRFFVMHYKLTVQNCPFFCLVAFLTTRSVTLPICHYCLTQTSAHHPSYTPLPSTIFPPTILQNDIF